MYHAPSLRSPSARKPTRRRAGIEFPGSDQQSQPEQDDHQRSAPAHWAVLLCAFPFKGLLAAFVQYVIGHQLDY